MTDYENGWNIGQVLNVLIRNILHNKGKPHQVKLEYKEEVLERLAQEISLDEISCEDNEKYTYITRIL